MADTREKFSPLTVALHWVIGLTIICLLAVGLYMTDLPKGEWRSELYGYHKLAGTTVFIVAAVRILWRWQNGMPVPAAGRNSVARRRWKFCSLLAGWALIGVILLHIIGALTHHVLDKDGTLRRMLGRRI